MVVVPAVGVWHRIVCEYSPIDSSGPSHTIFVHFLFEHQGLIVLDGVSYYFATTV